MGSTSTCINVGLGDRSYNILLGAGNLTDLAEELENIGFPRKIAIVTNTDLVPLYGEQLRDALIFAGLDVDLIAIPEGEDHKNLKTLELIYDELIRLGFDRSSGLIALGGGLSVIPLVLLRRHFSAAYLSFRCRRHCWLRSIALLVEKPPSIIPWGKT